MNRILIICIVISLYLMPFTASRSNQFLNKNEIDEFHEDPPGDENPDSSVENIEFLNLEHLDNDYDSHEDSLHHNTVDHPVKKSCKTCQGGVKMSEEELTALRIEFVKNQILKKLRLSERPMVSRTDLPRPVTEHLMPHPEVENRDRQLEDYYAKTTKKFILLQEGEVTCTHEKKN